MGVFFLSNGTAIKASQTRRIQTTIAFLWKQNKCRLATDLFIEFKMPFDQWLAKNIIDIIKYKPKLQSEEDSI